MRFGVAVWLAPAPVSAPVASGAVTRAPTEAELFVQAQAIVAQRCVMCHNDQMANKGVALHTPDLLRKGAQQVYQQAVVLKAMPMNNATQITEAERKLLGDWFRAVSQSGAVGP